ncbi:YkoP family protein [Deinococcus sonorensis]|uniref:YkoP-like domain-containing protein n=2 Tax=Deinococcus sonorensis TaxID=309891 RepID=A0AAU7UBQ4_9DEIO
MTPRQTTARVALVSQIMNFRTWIGDHLTESGPAGLELPETGSAAATGRPVMTEIPRGCLPSVMSGGAQCSLYCFLILLNCTGCRGRGWLLVGGLALLTWKVWPGWWHGRAHMGVLREAPGGRPVLGLSVDGGPDPALTPTLLRQLGRQPVTMFLTASSAAHHPDLTRQIVAAGYEIGLLLESQDAAAQRAQLERTVGTPVRLGRVSGRYGWLTLSRMQRAGLQAVAGFPAVAGPGVPAEPGGLLTLRTDQDSLTQLPDLLADLKRRGYQPMPVGQLEGLRSETVRGLLQRAWQATADRAFDRAHQVVPLTERARGLFRISARPYSGPPLQAAGGPLWRPGTPAAELHLHSKRLVAVADLSALTAYRAFRDSLQDVAAALQERPEFQQAQLIYGVTLFHEVLAPVGFEVQPLPDRRMASIMARFMDLLRRLYGARNVGRRVIHPHVVWMTRDTLMQRYGQSRR